jgi:ribonuclease PH
MAANGDFIEVQGTAEGATFNRAELDSLLDIAGGGIAELIAIQREALAG